MGLLALKTLRDNGVLSEKDYASILKYYAERFNSNLDVMEKKAIVYLDDMLGTQFGVAQSVGKDDEKNKQTLKRTTFIVDNSFDGALHLVIKGRTEDEKFKGMAL